MTTERLPDNKFGTASFALAIAIAGSAILVCHLALRTTTSGALLVAAEAKRIESVALATAETQRSLPDPPQHEPLADAATRGRVVLTGAIRGAVASPGALCSLVVEHGSIDPRDRHEWEVGVAEGTESHPLESLYSYVAGERATIDTTGRFEIEIREAPRYRVLIHDAAFAATREVALADAKRAERDRSCLALDLGEIQLEPIARLEIELGNDPQREPFVRGPFRVEVSRAAPTARGNEWSWRLRHLAGEAGDAILHGATLALPAEGLTLPVVPDETLRVRLISNASLRSRDFEVSVPIGRLHRLVIPLDEAFPPQAHARFAVRLVVAGSHQPIAGAEVRTDAGITVATDSEGRAEWEAKRVAASTLTVTRFDPELPERQEYVEITPTDGAGEQIIALEPTRWLRVTGIGPPPEMLVREPLAYRLEMRRPGGDWSAIALDVAKRDGDELSISITRGEAEYRVVALWSAICALESEPVAILTADRTVYTAFHAPREVPRFVRGRLIGADGSPLVGMTIEATAPGCGGIPPVAVVSDRMGSFTIGPIRASRLELVARLSTGDLVREVDPQQETDVAIDLRNPGIGGG